MKKIFISISILVITGILGMLMYNNITSEKHIIQKLSLARFLN